ncbi:AfsR/SARP family transcriptional regulator [Micromonospora sp. Llam0]|uniref:AfsR/SARP family transcriptional regulator n=1 Tax=Micromonospora sp. Llam0 TaxID=2485143 RepID=UPI000F4870DA|nr:AfsR/SARP family transcriptional regulator [Micromonospora sp. Llam0]
MSCIRFGLLGPFLVARHDQLISINAGKQRAVLARLLLQANRVVSDRQLIRTVWGDEPPPTAARTLHSLISRIRRNLPFCADGPVLTRHTSGYLLAIAAEQVDAHRFRRLVAEARAADGLGRTADVAAYLSEALELWRGDPLAGVPVTPIIAAECARLEEQRRTAVSDRIDADLLLGRHVELIAELRALATEQPECERVWWQLMLALHRSGRSAEALLAYQRVREVLSAELGADPTPQLQDLHRRILSADPELAAPPHR